MPIARATHLAVTLAALTLCTAALAQEPSEFKKRRAAVCKQMGQGQVLVLKGNTRGERQDSDFYYLTGMTTLGGGLILTAGGKATLFGERSGEGGGIRGGSSAREGQAGQQSSPSLEALGKASGIRKLASIDDFDDAAEKLRDADRTILSAREARSIFSRLRRIKSPAEIERLQKAIDITCEAHREAMRTAKPGLFEHEIEKTIEDVFTKGGAQRTGFPSIIGSGPNACILHWNRNTRQTEDGDVVVMDIGAECDMYTADVTRTIPVNGKFSERQRQIYEIVLAANEAAIAMIKPGVDMRQVSRKASEVLRKGLVKIGLIEKGDTRGLRKYYYHGLSHALGLVVHDVGGLGRLEPGMVLTIEPGLYLRDENMGFRIEDDVLVTKTGHRVLSAKAPKKVAEIEKLMASSGSRGDK